MTVSIHAPVMDANGFGFYRVTTDYVSIHAPVMDANNLSKRLTAIVSFNPRARDGREWSNLLWHEWHNGFNPRARDGREKSPLHHYDIYRVSIHAPVMDANLLP